MGALESSPLWFYMGSVLEILSDVVNKRRGILI